MYLRSLYIYNKKTIFDARTKRSWREHSPLFARESFHLFRALTSSSTRGSKSRRSSSSFFHHRLPQSVAVIAWRINYLTTCVPDYRLHAREEATLYTVLEPQRPVPSRSTSPSMRLILSSFILLASTKTKRPTPRRDVHRSCSNGLRKSSIDLKWSNQLLFKAPNSLIATSRSLVRRGVSRVTCES